MRVNAIAPGAILWPESGGNAKAQEILLERTALKRRGEPADIAEAAVFLLSTSNYTTGEVLRVDGGRWLTL